MPILLLSLLLVWIPASTNLSTQVAAAAAATKSETDALLRWKGSLRNHSTLLLSWSPLQHACNWSGISCSRSRISKILLSNAKLEGRLDALNFSSLPHLKTVNLSCNSLSGSIPPTIGVLPKLVALDLSVNDISGSLPPELGNLTRLEYFHICYNKLTGSLPEEVLQGGSLRAFTVDNNRLSGTIPRSFRNCSKLETFQLEDNHFTGNISESFGYHPQLSYLDLSHNHFYGDLSPTLGKYSNLTLLRVSGNDISGAIPSELGKLDKMQKLDLSSNRLVGEIPKAICRMSALFNLSLSDNRLSGNVPSEIGLLSKLQLLDLSMNSLSGEIPEQLGNCSMLSALNLSRNCFSRGIPFQIGNLVSLRNLDLSQNSLSEQLPSQFVALNSLEKLNLSHNMLSGRIPPSLAKMSSLTLIDFSYNNLEGPIPESKAFQDAQAGAFDHNGLCGNASGLPLCTGQHPHHMKEPQIVLLIAMIPSALVLAVAVLAIFLVISKAKSNSNQRGEKFIHCSELNETGHFSAWDYDGKAVYEEITRATDNFHDRHCIGSGAFGCVFKAELSSGQSVAVKKFHSTNDEGGEASFGYRFDKSFEKEVKTLTGIRHRNIVTLYGFCSNARSKFLIYKFVERGKLADCLSSNKGALELDWPKRINIVKGVAKALCYMHHDCSPPIVHRDISSSNVLLDSELEAQISDFGTSKAIDADSANWSSLVGTFGYVAPELAYSAKITTKCDVYSFGVLVLEVLMGRHPRDIIFKIHNSFYQRLQIEDILDDRLSPPSNCYWTEVNSILEVAIACIHVNPQLRPNMLNIYKKIVK